MMFSPYTIKASITSEAFARQNVGSTVRYTLATFMGGAKEFFGTVVGFTRAGGELTISDMVLIEPEDPKGIGSKIDEHLLSMFPDDTFVFLRTRPAYIDARRVAALTLLKPAQRYPDTCLECKAPAQLIFNMVDCSNHRCRHYRP